MAITVVARKLLWGRAGNRCAWPGCDQRLTVSTDDEETGILQTQGIILGEEAHIRSSKTDGPRNDQTYPMEKLDTYENLVLLCPTHHTVIDKDDGAGWPIDEVIRIKIEHERQVDQGRDPAAHRRQLLEERLVAELTVWEQKLGTDATGDWDGLTFGLNSPIPEIGAERFENLVNLGQWLLRRTWPSNLPKLRVAFHRHLSTVRVLVAELNEVMIRLDSLWRLDRPYKRLDRWDVAEYERLLRETNIRAVTIWYLTAELARSANLVIEAAREELEPLYRFHEGMLLSRDGDGVLTNWVIRDEYGEWDWSSPPEFPSVHQIRAAIVDSADPNDTRIERVNPRMLRPTARN